MACASSLSWAFIYSLSIVFLFAELQMNILSTLASKRVRGAAALPSNNGDAVGEESQTGINATTDGFQEQMESFLEAEKGYEGHFLGNLNHVINLEGGGIANLGQMQPAINLAAQKCSRKGCRVIGAELHPCTAKKCEKSIHIMCYQGICMKYKLNALQNGEVACTNTCHTKRIRELEDIVKEKDGILNLSWEKDGKGGPNDASNSMAVLLAWWTTDGNYRKYRGDGNKGEKKSSQAHRLAEKINRVSRCVRTAHSVRAKIQAMEQSWRKAHDWANETGQGVREHEGQESFEACILRRCSFYFIIYDVMADRCSSRPALTTNSLYGVDDEILVSSGDSYSSSADFVDETPKEGNKRKKLGGKKTVTPPTIAESNTNRDIKTTYSHLLDKETMDLLSGVNQVEKDKLEEVKRHNSVVEEETTYKGKRAKHDYKMVLLRDYQELRESGMVLEDIFAIFPDMKEFRDR